MTVKTALNHVGIEATEIDNSTWEGKTKTGKRFIMSFAGGAYGTQFTLDIEGMNRITHCLFRTAIRKIKTN